MSDVSASLVIQTISSSMALSEHTGPAHPNRKDERESGSLLMHPQTLGFLLMHLQFKALQKQHLRIKVQVLDFSNSSMNLSWRCGAVMALLPVLRHMRMGPVPGLEVAPEPFQVHRREVSSDSFSQPPLALCRAGTARLAELVPEMLSPNPPERKRRRENSVSELVVLRLPTTGGAEQCWRAFVIVLEEFC